MPSMASLMLRSAYGTRLEARTVAMLSNSVTTTPKHYSASRISISLRFRLGFAPS